DRVGLHRPRPVARLGGAAFHAERPRRVDESDWIDRSVIGAPPGWAEPAILCAEENSCSKVWTCVTGGETRVESVRAGVAEVPEDAVAILVHDAARPLVTDDVIGRVLAPLSAGWDGVVPGLPVAATLKRA